MGADTDFKTDSGVTALNLAYTSRNQGLLLVLKHHAIHGVYASRPSRAITHGLWVFENTSMGYKLSANVQREILQYL
jgi:hypothetical protein